MIEFAGIRSDERHLIVEHFPQRIFPKRKYIVQTIPGRSGDLYIEEGDDAFENYEQRYSVFLDSLAPGLQEASRGLAEWLLGHPGYQRLEDSYDPDTYRMAIYTGGSEFINFFNEYGRGTLTFNCAPKRFFKSGEEKVFLTENTPVYSPTEFKSRPLIHFFGTGGTTSLYMRDNSTMAISRLDIANVYGDTWIDIEKHFTYHSLQGGGVDNISSSVSGDYDSFRMGKSCQFAWSNANNVFLIPRWWTL